MYCLAVKQQLVLIQILQSGLWPKYALKLRLRSIIHICSKRIIVNAPVPLSPLESLASSVVRTANSTKAALILVLTRGGSTAKPAAKYRPGMPTLSVVMPEIKTDSLDWSCSDESPARHSLIFRGLIVYRFDDEKGGWQRVLSHVSHRQ